MICIGRYLVSVVSVKMIEVMCQWQLSLIQSPQPFLQPSEFLVILIDSRTN